MMSQRSAARSDSAATSSAAAGSTRFTHALPACSKSLSHAGQLIASRARVNAESASRHALRISAAAAGRRQRPPAAGDPGRIGAEGRLARGAVTAARP